MEEGILYRVAPPCQTPSSNVSIFRVVLRNANQLVDQPTSEKGYPCSRQAPQPISTPLPPEPNLHHATLGGTDPNTGRAHQVLPIRVWGICPAWGQGSLKNAWCVGSGKMDTVEEDPPWTVAPIARVLPTVNCCCISIDILSAKLGSV